MEEEQEEISPSEQYNLTQRGVAEDMKKQEVAARLGDKIVYDPNWTPETITPNFTKKGRLFGFNMDDTMQVRIPPHGAIINVHAQAIKKDI
jgi:hypothetical protein